MKNSRGLVRSKEFMKSSGGAKSKASFASQEESKTSEEAPYAPELHHMRVHPANSKGVVKVTHHLGEVAAPSETHAFDEKQGEEMTAHLMQHSGMPYDSEGGGDHYADEGEEVEA